MRTNSFLPDSWQRVSAPVAILTLLITNLIPLFGVLYLDWELYSIILVYWLENAVIGLFNVLKMAVARGETPLTFKDQAAAEWLGRDNYGLLRRIGGLFYIPFFLFHYGFFWVGHGVFIQSFFGPWFGISATSFLPSTWLPEGALGALGAMVISHGSSFVRNYLGQGEYVVATPQKLMGEPYTRVMVLHVTIIGGGALVMQWGEPLYGLLMLISLKTAVDLWAHLRQHKRYRAQELKAEAT